MPASTRAAGQHSSGLNLGDCPREREVDLCWEDGDPSDDLSLKCGLQLPAGRLTNYPMRQTMTATLLNDGSQIARMRSEGNYVFVIPL